MDQNTLEQTEGLAPANPIKKGRASKILLTGFLWTLAVLVTAIIVVGVGIYRFNWSGNAIAAIESVVPYPAAMVNWRIISRSEYAQRVTAFQNAVKFNQNYDFNDPKNQEEVRAQKQNILDRMIDLKLESILADQKRLKVTSEEIDREIQLMAVSSGIKQEDLDDMLNKVYGWKRADFIAQVVRPQILERNLQEALNADREVNSEAYNIAETVKQKIASGEDFAKLASEYSADTSSAEIGGDLGWVGKGQFVSSFEKAVFALEPGQVSDIVPTGFGLHIIQLVEKSGSEGDAQVHSRHILIATKDFGDWILEQKSKAVIWKFSVN